MRNGSRRIKLCVSRFGILRRFCRYSNPVLPEDYLVNHIASSFVETLEWWLSQNMKETPEVIHSYFLAVIEPTLRRGEI
ncbi:MAG: TetR family transcriptional regulator C-terminal domain-containing protein [Clostridia bacterium]|nr:TetR family transcriptional regulator C-terminal domain-containing protein [Clostridia bacterium]MBR6745699.1 TetR family transcriptional regulator C-terminal domain-containing protein [Clostridia bacterium]